MSTLTDDIPPTVIVYGPAGCGKTRNSAKLKELFGLNKVIDGWTGSTAIPRLGALVLTQLTREEISGRCLSVGAWNYVTAMAEIDNGSPSSPDAPTAPEILQRAAKHMEDRAKERDQPGGERSMGRCVASFNAATGHALSERDGWMFMAFLKAVRACTTPAGRPDDYEDGAAYFSLAGEAATR